ncbi:MFS transporter [Trinickia mobilis]|uniref:MFS transporter n=1 Tax=Trinickia mobilis TaxID=2816356 RepID=UPI001F5C3E6C|nr:MFS transporter [Trinickia mobilis]
MARYRDKLLPMVVSVPLLLQNIDTSIMGPALPAMASSLHVSPLRLNVAITAYLISLAIFLPTSGWLADRFGARRVFSAAIAIFSLSSGLCGFSTSLDMLVAFRVLQGLGGAMMVPVGRLILLRNIATAAMVNAMVWFTVPPTIGRLLGPLIGGVTVTWLSWPWIFLINIPIGCVAIALALTLIGNDDGPTDPTEARPFDARGFVLLGAGLVALLTALEGSGTQLMKGNTPLAIAAIGVGCLAAYVIHCTRSVHPLVDLRILGRPTFFAAVVGALPLRLATGAMPFLLPLMLQFGFGLSPLDSGMLTMAGALGSLATRVLLARAINQWGFKRLLLGATILTSACYFVYGQFRPTTPHAALFCAMLVGGLLMSMTLVSMQTLAFTEIPKPLMSHATALSTMAQHVSLSLGVTMSVQLLRVSVWERGGTTSTLLASDFPLAFNCIAGAILLALLLFRRLPADVGSELRVRSVKGTDLA